jgi:hypothetical protein
LRTRVTLITFEALIAFIALGADGANGYIKLRGAACVIAVAILAVLAATRKRAGDAENVAAGCNLVRRYGNVRVSEDVDGLIQAVQHHGRRQTAAEAVTKDVHLHRAGIAGVKGESDFLNDRGFLLAFVISASHNRRKSERKEEQKCCNGSNAPRSVAVSHHTSPSSCTCLRGLLVLWAQAEPHQAEKSNEAAAQLVGED